MNYPRTLADLIPWTAAHVAVWKGTPAALGLNASQTTLLDNAVKAAQAAFDDCQKKRQESKNATATQDAAVRTMLTLLQQDLRLIEIFATNSVNPNAVYTLAEIDPPTPPQPVGPPRMVSDISVGIEIVTGATVLKWKGNNPVGANGTAYIIKRKLQGQIVFSQVGIATSSGPDARTFTDNTLPAGVDSVSYTITPVRGSTVGPTAEVQVRFGVASSGGNMTATILGQPKMAA